MITILPDLTGRGADFWQVFSHDSVVKGDRDSEIRHLFYGLLKRLIRFLKIVNAFFEYQKTLSFSNDMVRFLIYYFM